MKGKPPVRRPAPRGGPPKPDANAIKQMIAQAAMAGAGQGAPGGMPMGPPPGGGGGQFSGLVGR